MLTASLTVWIINDATLERITSRIAANLLLLLLFLRFIAFDILRVLRM